MGSGIWSRLEDASFLSSDNGLNVGLRIAMLLCVVLCVSLAGACKRVDTAAVQAPRERTIAAQARVRTFFLRAWLAEERGEIEEANRAYKWMLLEAGDDPWTHVVWGDYLRRRRLPAEDAYRTALKGTPELPEAHVGLAIVLMERDEVEQATQHLERAIHLEGSDSGAFALYGRVLLGQKKQDRAEGLLSQWRKLPLDRSEAFAQRAEFAVELGEYDAAIEDLLESLALHPRVPAGELLVEATTEACRLKTLNDWALQLNVERLGGGTWRALVYRVALTTGDPRVLELSGHGVSEPLRNAIRVNDIWVSGGQFDRAKKHALATQSRFPEAIAARWLVFRAAVLGGDEAALSDLQALASSDGGDGGNRQFLVDWLVSKGRKAEAVQYVKQWASGPEDIPEVVSLWVAVGRMEEARRLLQSTLPQERESVEMWMAMAELEPERRQLWVDKVLAEQPCHPDALALRILDLEGEERCVAREKWREAVGWWPTVDGTPP